LFFCPARLYNRDDEEVNMNTVPPVRPSPIAGSWYSDKPAALSKEVEGYISSAEIPPLDGDLVGLIAPHAGYFYLGSTAGYAYRAVQDMHFDLCMVVSPLHNYLPYPLLSSAHAAYSTPLGNVEVDHDLLNKLETLLTENALPGIQLIANDREHSLEIQLPFLQTALIDSFRLLPLMVRTYDADFLQKTAGILAELVRVQKTLLVASTDLSHFYDENTATALDKVMLKRMSDFSPLGVLQAEANEEGFACGSGAVALVLWTAKALGANKVTLLHHTTSAHTSGDKTSVVGYGALAITRQEGI
jgi:AmmeMemoRadiSam system protein B